MTKYAVEGCGICEEAESATNEQPQIWKRAPVRKDTIQQIQATLGAKLHL